MGFGEIFLIAATTSDALAEEPASTTTTPSSPTWTPMFAPAPAIMKKFDRTAMTPRPSCAAPEGTHQNAAAAVSAMTSGRRWTLPATIFAVDSLEHALGWRQAFRRVLRGLLLIGALGAERIRHR